MQQTRHCFSPSCQHVFRTLVLACFMGTGGAIIDKIKNAADKAKQGRSDAFDSTGEWAENTWQKARGAAEKATDGVKTRIDKVGEIIEGTLNDEEKAEQLLTIAFPECRDIKHTITGELNSTMTNTIESMMRLQKCTEDARSEACLEALKETLTSVMFEALWIPLKTGVGSANPALKAGLILLKPTAKTLLKPALLVAADPMASTVHEVLKSAELDTSTADAILSDIKESLLGVKDDMLRAVEASMRCSELGMEYVDSARRRQVVAVLVAMLSVQMLFST